MVEVSLADTDKTAPVAVIGMACRFPGDGTNTEQLFEMLRNGVSAWSEFPADRVNIDGFYHPSGNREGSIPFRGAHFLKGNIAAFDASFFNISANEAKAIDPQQRILLEVTYEALENAGVPIESIDGSETTVNVGSFVKDYEQIVLRDPDWSPQYAATGTGAAILANRISHTFNLMGPSQTIDTGCSGSLIAVHNCCLDLRTGRSSLAIAAGVGMILTPATMMPMTALNFLSPNGKCFTFSEKANGYGRGEGVGVVILKKLEDALRDNDTIRAVIRGSRTNQDGRTPGITMPSSESQLSNIRAVYEEAGLDVSKTAFVECHGTGTQAGDPKEANAIYKAFCENRNREQPILIGSIKPNIGHLEGAAGVAGLIKAALSVERGQIPKNLHFEPPGNPAIRFEQWNVKVPTETIPWPMAGLRRASVNCFGFGGSNCHIIIDDAHNYLQERGLEGKHNSAIGPDGPPSAAAARIKTSKKLSSSYLFVFSSHEQSGVHRVIESQLTYVRENVTTVEKMADYAYTLSRRRSRLEYGAFIVASSPTELLEKMAQLPGGSISRWVNSPEAPLEVALVFCGQGAQWHSMGRELMQHHTFARNITEASDHLLALGSSFNLFEELMADKDKSRINRPEIAQPATTAIQVALVDFIRAFNMKPIATVGHSSGEIAAAYAAGYLTKEDAWKIAFKRGYYAASVDSQPGNLKGAMLAVGLSKDDVQKYLAMAREDSIWISCYNSPASITLSGDRDQILFLSRQLTEGGIFNRLLPVTTAYHSPHMMTVQAAYRDSVSSIIPSPGHSGIEMFSSATLESKDLESTSGKAGSLKTKFCADYWAENLVGPVYFDTAFEQMYRKCQPDLIIEVGPSAALRRPVQQILQNIAPGKSSVPCLSLLEKNKHAGSTALAVVGELWARGYQVDLLWTMTSRDGNIPQALVDIPPYPWNHSRMYWHESHLGKALRFRKHGREDLIGALTADSSPQEPRWRGFFRLSENPWMQDHQVQKTIVYPAAGMIVMALEAAKQLADPNREVQSFEVSDFTILKPMVIPATEHGLENMINAKIVRLASDGTEHSSTYSFSIYTKPLDAQSQENAHGLLTIQYKPGHFDDFAQKEKDEDARLHREKYHDMLHAPGELIAPRHLYEKLDIIGMNYGPLFQNITEVKKTKSGGCISVIQVPNTKDKMPGKYEFDHIIHPATLDAIFQTVFAIGDESMVPSYCKSIYFDIDIPRGAGQELVGYATASRKGLRTATADIIMSEAEWEKPLIAVKGLEFTSLTSIGGASDFLPNHRNLCSEVVWEEDIDFAKPNTMQDFFRLLAHKKPDLKILQIDQDDALAAEVLSALSLKEETPMLSRYTILSSSDAAVNDTLSQDTTGQWAKVVDSVETLNGAALYDVVLISTGTDRDLAQIAKHLAPSCSILLTPPGPGREFDSTVAVALGAQIPSSGYHSRTSLACRGADDVYCFITQRMSTIKDAKKDVFILVPEGYENNCGLSTLAHGLASELTGDGIKVTISTVGSNIDGEKLYVSLLDIDKENPFLFSIGEKDFQMIHNILSNSGGLLWVTNASQMQVENPRGALFHALARTVRSEDASKTITSLDLDTNDQFEPTASVSLIASVLKHSLISSHTAAVAEVEYVECKGRLYIPRLRPLSQLNRVIEDGPDCAQKLEEVALGDAKEPVKMNIGNVGDFSSIYFDEETPCLGGDEVLIQVETTRLLPEDLDTVLGKSNRDFVGTDVMGIIVAAGHNVDTSRIFRRQSVIAVACGTIKELVKVDQRFVYNPLKEAVPSPTATLTAYYALKSLGQLCSGDTVFIYAAASVYGQAAVRYAKNMEATILAGVTDHKQRQLLRSKYNLEDDAILYTMGDAFVAAVRRLTFQKGVDIVFNPTPENVDNCIQCAAACGQIIQLAHHSLPRTYKTLSSATYHVFDLCETMRKRPKVLANAFSSAPGVDLAEHLVWGPFEPVHRYDVGNISNAFAAMKDNGPYFGDYVLDFRSDSRVKVAVKLAEPAVLDLKATYIIVGGLGGLGRSVAKLLIEKGAQHLAFLSRSAGKDHDSRNFIESIEADGVDVKAFPVDICDLWELQHAIRKIEETMAPVKGAIQAAAVLKDSTFENMKYSDWDTAIKPKTIGSWNLHKALPENMDFLIFLSSAAGVIGNRGQANYAAGNGFQDALSQYRTQRGMRSVSLDLGPVLGAGMVAEDDDTMNVLRASGFFGVRLEDFHFLVDRAIAGRATVDEPRLPAQIVTGVGTGGLMLQNDPADPYWTRTRLFSHLNMVDLPQVALGSGAAGSSATSGGSGAADMQAALRAAAGDSGEAGRAVCAGLTAFLAPSLNMQAADLDADKALGFYGVDSLVATNIRNWVFRAAGVKLTDMEVMGSASIMELAKSIAVKGGFADEG